MLVLTRVSSDRLAVLLAGPQFLEQAWRERLRLSSGQQDVEFALSDADGRTVLGLPSVPLASQSVRTPSVTQLPWTVHAIRSDDGGPPMLSAPARLMLAALAGMTIVVIAGGYFITRAIAREVTVARLQSDFAATVSHEFRTPLTTLRHLSELLVGGRVSSEARRQEFYDTMLRESQRLQGLVEGLLNFARLESGQLEYRFAAVEPAAFLREIVDDFQADDGRAGQVRLDAATDVPAIRADRELLARVVWNLLDNAVKYSPPGRAVQVQLRNIAQPGIDSGDRRGIRNPEGRAGRDLRPVRPRLLGADAGHQGHRHRPGDGARDRPGPRRRSHGRERPRPGQHVHNHAALRAVSRRRARERGDGMTTQILVVEDDAGIALGLEEDLSIEGYGVEVVRDGETAVRRAREGRIDLILLDVMLPGKDGFAVCRELRSVWRRDADHPADRAGRGSREGARAAARRRRLPDQAVQPARAARAHPGGAAPNAR